MAFTGNASTISTHAALRLLSHAIDQTAFVMSANAPPDGGGGTYVYVATDTSSGCTFTGSVTGTTLSVTSVTNGALAIGFSVNRSDTGAAIGRIVPGGTGTGGVGTYNLSASASITGPFAFTADNDSSLIVAVDGGRWFNVGYFQPTAAEANTGINVVNPLLPCGNMLRYGIVANSTTAAASNTSIIQTLFNPTIINGPQGQFYFPNTTGADTYFFSGCIPCRANIHIDAGGCVISLGSSGSPVTGVSADTASGFFMAQNDFSFVNGTINVFWETGVSTSSGNAFRFGFRGSDSGRWPLNPVYDSLLTLQQGGFKLEDVRISCTVMGANVSSCAAIAITGGVNGLDFSNLYIAGMGTDRPFYGINYEFGWANSGTVGDTGQSSRQTSHLHNARFTNIWINNLDLVSGVGIFLTGAYDCFLDGIYTKGVAVGISCNPGEAQYFRPWVGFDDTGCAPAHFVLHNIVCESVASAGVLMQGTAPLIANNTYLTVAWAPLTTVVAGQTICNQVTTASASQTIANPGVFTTAAQSYSAGQPVTITGTAPGGFSNNVTYFVTSTSLSSTTCTLAATPGGTPMQCSSSSPCSLVQIAMYVTAAGGVTGNVGGPTSVNPGLDGSVTWTYVDNRKFTDLIDFSIDGFNINGASGANAIFSYAGYCNIINGAITGCGNALVISEETTRFNIDGVKITGAQQRGIYASFTASAVWSPVRSKKGTIRNCYIAGNSVATPGAVSGIDIKNFDGVTIENCRFGYETAYSFIQETTQGSALFLSAPTNCANMRIRGCRVAGSVGGVGFSNNSNSANQGNTVENCTFNAAGTSPVTMPLKGAWLADIESATSVAIATGSTVTTSGIGSSRLNPAAAVTGIIMQAGSYQCQLIVVINEAAAAKTITMAAVGTSHVADGISCVIPGLTQKTFYWDTATANWYHS